MKDPPNAGPDDWLFDAALQMWLRHSGKARWRKILAERRTHREAHAAEYEALRARFKLGRPVLE